MKISKKRTCGNCRCLQSWRKRCELGYQIISIDNGLLVKYAPAEPCPKPQTVEDHVTAINNLKAQPWKS